jgi:NOL1/NOP2/fmu family ribosome biogenesis protein
VEAVGMKAFHFIGDFIKPSTRFIQVFGRYATRCRIELDGEDLDRLIRDREIPADARVENGYMILYHRGDPLGLGLLLNGRLRSQIPKSEARFVQSSIPQSIG